LVLLARNIHPLFPSIIEEKEIYKSCDNSIFLNIVLFKNA
jgi:hypothetical protein